MATNEWCEHIPKPDPNQNPFTMCKLFTISKNLQCDQCSKFERLFMTKYKHEICQVLGFSDSNFENWRFHDGFIKANSIQSIWNAVLMNSTTDEIVTYSKEQSKMVQDVNDLILKIGYELFFEE